MGQNEDGNQGMVMRSSVVVRQITGIGRDLVEVGLSDVGVIFEFEDEDLRVGEDDQVGTATPFTRKFVFEDESPGSGGREAGDQVGEVGLEGGEAVGPGCFLGGFCGQVRGECAQESR